VVARLAYALVDHGAAGRPGRGRDWAEEGPDLRVDRLSQEGDPWLIAPTRRLPPLLVVVGLRAGQPLGVREGAALNVISGSGAVVHCLCTCPPFPTPRRARIILLQVSRCPLCVLDTPPSPSHVGYISDRCKCVGVLDTPPSPSPRRARI
jgi:hypothetical protein